MSYSIVISKSVQKQINDLPSQIRSRMIEKIQSLAQEPRPSGVVKLKASGKEYRIRIGNYRVRYEIDDSSQIIRLLELSIEEMSIESK